MKVHLKEERIMAINKTIIYIAFTVLVMPGVSAFLGGHKTAFVSNNNGVSLIAGRKSISATTTQQNCICIDCARVTNCKAYHFVETKHNQPHMTDDPDFMPQDGSPTIHVNVRTIRTEEERKAELERMWGEHQEETTKAEASGQHEYGRLVGEQKYDLSPKTVYEYDVVKCEDYVHDPGCWVRNMPEEIKEANPNFVPS